MQTTRVPRADGGPTSAANGQGLCEACNYAKETPGWSAEPLPDGGRHQVEITTPTGHRYSSRAPAPPGHRADIYTPLETRLREILRAA